jgi:nitrous oxidase accessory protein NosD
LILIVPPTASLQEAIDAAPEGAVIQLQAREYVENLTIEKSITLRGFPDAPERALLGSKSSGPVVTIRGSEGVRVMLEGFTVHGGRGYLPDGVLCQSDGETVLRSLVVRDCRGSGVSVYGRGEVRVERCILRDNSVYGLTVVTETATVMGSGNRFEGNGVPLGRYAAADLRTPLAEPTEHETVRVPEDYTTVQEAIDAVRPGGIVEIGDGEFLEGLVLWKDVTLRGRGTTATTLAPLPGRVIGLSFLHTASSITLEDLSVVSSGAAPIESNGDLRLSNVALIGTRGVYSNPFLWVTSGGRLTVSKSRFAQIGGEAIRLDEGATIDLGACEFEGNKIDLHLSGNAQVADCHFVGARDTSILAESGELSVNRSVLRGMLLGINVMGAQVAMRACSFEQIRDAGLVAEAASNVLLQDCTFVGGEHSVLIRGESTASLEQCEFSGATAAAAEVSGTGTMILDKCEVAENEGPGVHVIGWGDCTIADSSIRSNGYNTWNPVINCSGYGAGVHVTRNASLRMENTTVRNNSGAGIRCSTELIDLPLDRVEPSSKAAHVELVGCRFESNDGPALFASDQREIRVTACEFAQQSAGVFLTDLASVFVEESVFTTNMCGILGQGNSRLVLQSSSILLSPSAGLILQQQAMGVVERAEFADNGIGVLLTESVALEITDSTIAKSLTYGISLGCAECWPPGREYDTAWDFVGVLAGEGNLIPNPGEPGENRSGAFCPEDIGSELPRPSDDPA